MKCDVLVVGSGASGVHFAKQALAQGRRVVLVDVGVTKPAPVLPDASFLRLKRDLDSTHDYFLGPKDEALILPDNDDEYYGFPPSKEFVFEDPEPAPVDSRGFEPLFSYARGGLAEAWTGGSYPFNDEELAGFPFGYAELGPHYSAVAEAIGLSGSEDDLAQFMPFHNGIEEPVELDAHAQRLMATYARKREKLNKRSFVMGRARLALLTSDRGERRACSKLDRCLWGCPTGSIYTPSWTLKELQQSTGFHYVPGHKMSHFKISDSKVTGIVCNRLEDQSTQEFDCDHLVMAAGTLESARIFLKSLACDSQELPELTGLMDNRQVLMPFVNFGMLGKKWDDENYQYHQLAMGLNEGGPMDYVHGLVTTLKSALIHPVVQSLPFSLGTSARFFREMHAALGLVNINFSDRPRETNRIALEVGADKDRLLIRYEPATDEKARIEEVCGRFRSILRTLGCLAPGGMTHMRPMGASVHYAGSLPMTKEGGPWTLDATGRSRSFDNLWFVDGTGLPELPAKNLTFTLMANAARIAEVAFS